MQVDDPVRVVGLRLRELRSERGLSVRGLAQISSLSFNTISMIERGRISPTVSTLHKLAAALGVPLAYMVSKSPVRRIVFQKASDRRRATSAHVLLEDLGSGFPNPTLQPILSTLPPGTTSGADTIAHTGNEFAYCLDGRVDYWVGGDHYLLEPGDSLLFEAQLPHRWGNHSAEIALLLLVLQAGEGQEQALSGHLARLSDASDNGTVAEAATQPTADVSTGVGASKKT
jgi:transcriptional regulator with XRE-family HTH domain